MGAFHHGGNGSTRSGGLMRVSPATRSLGIVALVLAALLGSAYAIGRSLLPDRPPSGVTTAATGPDYADQEPTPGARGPGGHGPAEPERSRAPKPSPEPTVVDGIPTYGAHSTTGTSTVALTFDDGPDPQYTPQVLEALREFGVTATFCVVGEMASAHPDLIRAIVAEGHTLCNHSWSHDVDLGSRSTDRIRSDLLRTNEAIRAAVPDVPVAYYRQPGGAWTYSVVSAARELDMTPLHWTVDPTDWQAPGAGRIAATVLTGVEPGAVVLLHDAGGDRQGTVDALYRILPELTSRFHVAALPPGTT